MLLFLHAAIHREAVLVEARPPRIASVAGITTGVTLLKDFERRHGKGLPHLGASAYHGNYYQWYDARHGLIIDAGGANQARGGQILDALSVAWLAPKDVEKGVPSIRLQDSELGLLKKLHRGMSRHQVETALGVRLSGDVLGQKGQVRYSAAPTNKSNDRYTRWRLSLRFGEKGLQALTLFCR